MAHLFEKYSGRILYGTDANSTKSPDNYQLYDFTKALLDKEGTSYTHPYWKIEVKALGLSDETIKNITYNNYKKFVGTPKKVNEEMLFSCAKRVFDDITKNPQISLQMLGDADHEIAKMWLEEFLKRVES